MRSPLSRSEFLKSSESLQGSSRLHSEDESDKLFCIPPDWGSQYFMYIPIRGGKYKVVRQWPPATLNHCATSHLHSGPRLTWSTCSKRRQASVLLVQQRSFSVCLVITKLKRYWKIRVQIVKRKGKETQQKARVFRVVIPNLDNLPAFCCECCAVYVHYCKSP